jgi:hypothetical protein
METKPALKTTEFWIHAGLQIFFLLNTLNVWNYVPNKYSAIVQAVMVAGYSISRGQAKAGVAYNPNPTPTDSTTYPEE